MDRADDEALRVAAFAFLDRLRHLRGREAVRREDVAIFEYEGRRISLMPTQQGIWKPRGMDTALSFVTKFSTNEDSRPYADEVGVDGYLRYKWRGTNGDHWDNVAMRNAMLRGLPLIWFKGVAKATYLPVYPVWLLGEEPMFQQFVVSLDEARPEIEDDLVLGVEDPVRRYAESIARSRLHQKEFRERILIAYRCQCALCSLRHAELIDAAHIKADSKGGEPLVSNGIAMCKIHHAAYDNDIMGIRGDYRIQLRKDVLEEADGPTLRHALQGLHGEKIWTPPSKREKPDRDLLDERFQRFLNRNA